MVESPFKISIWNNQFKWLAYLEGLEELTLTVKHNDAGTASLEVPASNPRIAALNTDGCRVGIDFRGDTLITGLLDAGKGSTREGRGPRRAGVQTFTVVDDKRVLKQIRAWPNPAGSAAQQGEEGAYYTIGRRPAETVLKDVVTKNVVNRIGPGVMPFTVAPDLGRGGIMEASFRFHPIFDRMFPSFDLAGLGYNIFTRAGGRVLDVYVPRKFPLPLSTENRVIQEVDWSHSAPTVSRGTVAGQGQGTARIIKTFRDAALEARWGEVWEVAVDARDTADGDTYTLRGQEALADGAARASASFDLLESAGYFQYGGPKGVKVGDLLTAQISESQISVVDVLREVTMSWNQAAGLKIRSNVGVKDDPTAPVFEAITALGKGLRDVKTGI